MQRTTTESAVLVSILVILLGPGCGDAAGSDGGIDATGEDDSEVSNRGDGGADLLDRDGVSADAPSPDVGPDVASDLPVEDDWACLGSVDPPVFVPGSATGTLTVASFPGGQPLGGVTVAVCAFADRDCTAPSDSGDTDGDGRVELAVPTGLLTYYRLSGGGVAPSLFFRRGLPPDSDPFEVEIGALTAETLNLFAAAVGVSLDAERGHMVFTARDCQSDLAADVVLTVDALDEDSVQVYLAAGLPSLEADRTDESGRGGALNVPVGDVRVEAALAADDTFIGSRDVYVRPGWVSFIGVLPSAD